MFHLRDRYDTELPHLAHCRFLLAEVGPISILVDAEERMAWFGEQEGDFLRYVVLDDDAIDPFGGHALWKTIENWSGSITFWMSSRDAQDLSFLCFLAANFQRIKQIDIVDVDCLRRTVRPFLNVGECNSDQLGEAAQHATRLSDDQVVYLQRTYAGLVENPSGLRVVRDGTLIEVPMTFFDKYMIASMTVEWQKLPKVVGMFWADLADKEHLRIDYLVMLWRLSLLEEAGVIERRGESLKPLFDENPLMGEVRLCSNVV